MVIIGEVKDFTNIEGLSGKNGIPYSGKFSLGANFHDFCGQTSFRENINRKKMNQDGIDDS